MRTSSFDIARFHAHLSLQALSLCRVMQVVAREEAGLRGLPGGSLVAHAAAATLDGRRFALLAIAAGEAFPAGSLAGAALHW